MRRRSASLTAKGPASAQRYDYVTVRGTVTFRAKVTVTLRLG